MINQQAIIKINMQLIKRKIKLFVIKLDIMSGEYNDLNYLFE